MTDQELEDMLADAIDDTLDADWTGRVAAKVLVPILRERFVPRVEGVEPVAWLYKYHVRSSYKVDYMGTKPSLPPVILLSLSRWSDSQRQYHDETPLYPESALASLQAQVARNMADTQRLIWKDEAAAVCPSVEICFEYGEHVRCGPCAINLAQAAGIVPDMSLPNLPEVSRLRREVASLQAELERVREAFRNAADVVAVWAQQPVESTRQRSALQQQQWDQLAQVIGEMFAEVTRQALSENPHD